MSFLAGPLSGAVVAGGVYYGLSNLISTRTEQHRRDLHRLSVRLSETPTLIQAPPPASARIEHNELSSYIKAKWNQEIAYLAAGFREWDRRALEWGRDLVYGSTTSSSTKPSTPASSSTAPTSS